MASHNGRERIPGAEMVARRPCDAVCEAEDTVRRAWESVLLNCREQTESTVQAALANCHTAYRLVAQAQHDGDPGEISTAHVYLHEAVDAARRSLAASQSIRHALLAELDLLARMTEEHARAAHVRQPVWVGPWLVMVPMESAEPVELAEPAKHSARARRFVAAARRLSRVPAWVSRCLVRMRECASGAGSG